MHVLSAFLRGEWTYAGACYVSSGICFTCYKRDTGTVSPFCFDNMDDLVSAPLLTEFFLFVHNQIVSLFSTAEPDSLKTEL